MTKMNDKQIAAYEAKGFNRWTKGSMDRLYINATDLGLEVEYYKTGNVSSAKWDGESISNADARRFNSSKVFVDINTGELHVQDRTTVDWHVFDQATLEDKAQALIDEIEAELAEPEVTEDGNGETEQHETASKMTDKSYTFESANKGEIYVTIDGEYEYGTKDISIDVNGEDGTMIEDTDDAADVINWLIDNGVLFKSKRSMLANYHYIQGVLIDREATPEKIWDEIMALTDQDVEKQAEHFES